jgi:hypothetical protein
VKRADGFTTIQYVAATGFSLVLFVLVANLLVALYQRGVVRDALDEGVRVGVTASTSECERRVHDVIAEVAGGSLLRVERLGCARDGDRLSATATVTLRSWFPALVPDRTLYLRASGHVDS